MKKTHTDYYGPPPGMDEEDMYPVSAIGSDGKSINLRTDNELFDEEEYKKDKKKFVQARCIFLPKKGIEDWEILVDGQSVLLMKGTRFTNAEKEFLRSVDGIQFLISSYKEGKKSVVKIKEELKKLL